MAAKRTLEEIIELQNKCKKSMESGLWKEITKSDIRQLHDDLNTLDSIFDSLAGTDDCERIRLLSEEQQEIYSRIVQHNKESLSRDSSASFASSSLVSATASPSAVKSSSAATQGMLKLPNPTSGSMPIPSQTSATSFDEKEFEVSDKDHIGTGLWGSVYSHMWHSRKVAVKVPPTVLKDKKLQEFSRLARTLEQIHGNMLVPVLKIVANSDMQMIVTEMMQNDLQVYLTQFSKAQSHQEIMKIVYDVACGLNWLHNVGVAHSA